MKSIVIKNIIALLALVAASASAFAQGVKGEKTFSLEAGYAEYNSSGLAGIEFTYRFSRHFRLAPSVDYIFRHNGSDALTININCQIPFAVANRVEVFPLAGVCFSGWNGHSSGSQGDVTTRVTRFGLNIGAGASMRLSKKMIIGLAADYVIIKDFGGVEVMAKIGYVF